MDRPYLAALSALWAASGLAGFSRKQDSIMSFSCVTGGRLCDGCMACHDDPYYGTGYRPDDEKYEEEYIDEQDRC